MRIVQLTPGTGNFHCGNCMRDNTLVLELRRIGHDAMMVPMYLPHVVEGEEAGRSSELFFGGINVYLQHKLPLMRRMPGWVDRLFNAPSLLRLAAGRSGMTSARDLGELTVSMLGGEEGTQRKELDKLIRHLETVGLIDVIVLSNAMLAGLARELRRRLGAAVVCTMAGEDGFLDALADPWRQQAWQMLAERSRDVDQFIAVSDYHGSLMRQRLGLAAERVSTVYNGIDFTGYFPAPSSPSVPTVGFLARLCRAKGIDVLVEAFIELRRRGKVGAAKLLAVGAATPEDEALIATMRQRLRGAGLEADAAFETNVTLERKQELLRRMSVLSVPTAYGESFGLYVLEALASGVPVVLPRRGAFGELLGMLGGGELVEMGEGRNGAEGGAGAAGALAEGLEIMLLRGEAGRAEALAAREKALGRFTSRRMAGDVLAVLESATERHAQGKQKATG
jgi:glycosyltransferase involved in cell wall biosynthesis